VQTLVQEGRGDEWLWNTQDAGFLAEALVAFEAGQKIAARRGIRVRGHNGRVLFTTAGSGVVGDTSISLQGLLTDLPNDAEERKLLRVSLDARGQGTPSSSAAGYAAYYYITVNEVPREPPVTPSEQGIQVERWYESYDTGKPLVSVAEGELVRVRLRVTVRDERHFVVLDDALPAGLEAVDLSLRTTAALPGPGTSMENELGQPEPGEPGTEASPWGYGSWDAGWWSPWDHRELRDDRVVYAATVLWPGSYTATYVARATTPGVFVRPPAHAEEMYNPAVNGRSDGGVFTVTK
jgi:uncharacterized protein YfaS (alpha-2-macroglobulin family)